MRWLKMRCNALIVLAVFCAGCAVGVSREADSVRPRGDTHEARSLSAAQESPEADETMALMRRLQSEDQVERTQAKKDVEARAAVSTEVRAQIVQALIKLVAQSDERLRATSFAHYDAWSFAAEFLGTLKATESVDVLVGCISCNDGTGGTSSYRHPAWRGVVKIGPAAVPRLGEALRGKDTETRIYAAWALGVIGGAEARAALEGALPFEKDKVVENTIRRALQSKDDLPESHDLVSPK
jgi:HEAT repeat protein